MLAVVSETMRRKESLDAALDAEATLLQRFPGKRLMVLVLAYELVVKGGSIKGGAKSELVREIYAKKAALSGLLSRG